MAWSYRQDRADELYADTLQGPAFVSVPTLDPQAQEKKRKEFDEKIESGEYEKFDGSGNPVIFGPETGPPVLTPAARAKKESALVKVNSDLEQHRLAGIERQRLADAELTRLRNEETGKDAEKVKKQAEDDAKKAFEAEKKERAEAEATVKKQHAEKKEPVHAGR